MIKTKIAVIGNCQVVGIAKILSLICNAKCDYLHLTQAKLRNTPDALINTADYDFVFIRKYTSPTWQQYALEKLKGRTNIIFIPDIVFTGFHPDFCIITKNEMILKSPIGDYHSSIVANSYLNGFSIEECKTLFKPEFYSSLGYLNHFKDSIQALTSSLSKEGLDAPNLISRWLNEAPFMHTTNHPKLIVLETILKALCNKNSIEFNDQIDVQKYVEDDLKKNVILPLYSGIFNNTTSADAMLFKISPSLNAGQGKIAAFSYNLDEFISKSYDLYKKEKLVQADLQGTRVVDFLGALKRLQSLPPKREPFAHPYKKLEDFKFWARGIARIKPDAVNPAVGIDLKISHQTKVATAGSCFAQHIARTLAQSGMNYYVAEAGDPLIPSDRRKELGYGLFSARYGNIYTTRQLKQLFDRAYGTFNPNESIWKSENAYIDPYRPNIGEFFASESELLADRERHFSAVREMFENLDVFVFTMGLTESWEDTRDGAVFPVPPGVISINENRKQFRFVNFDYCTTKSDLIDFIDRLRSVNPTAQIILTVSPVPLVATMEQRHILTSTTASKSILRAVADGICKSYPFVKYFPSYEIITGNYNRGSYFANDLRSVVDAGVAHVMRLFMKECVVDDTVKATVSIKRPENTSIVDKIRDEAAKLSEVICDEELLTPSD